MPAYPVQEMLPVRAAQAPGARGGAVARTLARLAAGRTHLAAAALIAAGLAYRMYLLVNDVPPTNSDEATMGLAALHVAQGRDYPVFFYGQAYLGTLQAYLTAPLMRVLGPSLIVLRLPPLLFYLAFATGMYLLTRRLHTPGLALFVVAVLALGSDRTIKDQLIGGGGYPEINAAAVWLILGSLALVSGRTRRRTPVLASWGVVAGLLFWVDWLILPYLAAAAAVLLAGWWPRAGGGNRLGAAATVVAGFAVGAAPLIAFNLTHPPAQNSLRVFLRLSHSSATTGIDQHLYGGLAFGIPMGTGVCAPNRCDPWQTWWAAAYVVLLAVAAVLAVRRLRRAADREDRGRAIGRLALLGAAAVSLATYVYSDAAATSPIESARYLTPAFISLPAVLWPAWAASVGAVSGWAGGGAGTRLGRRVAGGVGRARGGGARRPPGHDHGGERRAGRRGAGVPGTGEPAPAVHRHPAPRRHPLHVQRLLDVRRGDLRHPGAHCLCRRQPPAAAGPGPVPGLPGRGRPERRARYVVTDVPGVTSPIAACLRATGVPYRMIRSGRHRIYEPVGPVPARPRPGYRGAPCARR